MRHFFLAAGCAFACWGLTSGVTAQDDYRRGYAGDYEITLQDPEVSPLDKGAPQGKAIQAPQKAVQAPQKAIQAPRQAPWQAPLSKGYQQQAPQKHLQAPQKSMRPVQAPAQAHYQAPMKGAYQAPVQAPIQAPLKSAYGYGGYDYGYEPVDYHVQAPFRYYGERNDGRWASLEGPRRFGVLRRLR